MHGNLSLLQWEKALKEMHGPEHSQLMVSSILISVCLKGRVFNRQPGQINWALLPGSCSTAVSVRGIWNVRLQTAQSREWSNTLVALAFKRQKQESQEFKVILGNTAMLRPAWGTWDPVSRSDHFATCLVSEYQFPTRKIDGDICLLRLWIRTSSKHTWEAFN